MTTLQSIFPCNAHISLRQLTTLNSHSIGRETSFTYSLQILESCDRGRRLTSGNISQSGCCRIITSAVRGAIHRAIPRFGAPSDFSISIQFRHREVVYYNELITHHALTQYIQTCTNVYSNAPIHTVQPNSFMPYSSPIVSSYETRFSIPLSYSAFSFALSDKFSETSNVIRVT